MTGPLETMGTLITEGRARDPSAASAQVLRSGAGILDRVPPNPLDAADLRDRVQKVLEAFLARQQAFLDDVADDLTPVADGISDFVLDGGKRLGPAFCYWGWRGA